MSGGTSRVACFMMEIVRGDFPAFQLRLCPSLLSFSVITASLIYCFSYRLSRSFKLLRHLRSDSPKRNLRFDAIPHIVS